MRKLYLCILCVYIVAIFRWAIFTCEERKWNINIYPGRLPFRRLSNICIIGKIRELWMNVEKRIRRGQIDWSLFTYDTHHTCVAIQLNHTTRSHRPPLVSTFFALLFSDLFHSFFVSHINFCLSNYTLFLCHYLMNPFYVLSLFDRACDCNRKN